MRRKTAEIRADVEWMLRAFEEAGPIPLQPAEFPAGATHKIPVVYSATALQVAKAKELPVYTRAHVPLKDDVKEEGRAWWNCVRELKRALEEEDSPYWIAFLAMRVGAGTTLPDVRARQNKRTKGRNARLKRIEEEREGIQLRNDRLRRRLVLIRKARDYQGESFTAVCKLIAADYTQHGLEHLSGKQVQRICADLSWPARQRKT